jgi:hypothetical protein
LICALRSSVLSLACGATAGARAGLVDSGQAENKFIDEQFDFLAAKINRVVIKQALLNLLDLAIFAEAQFAHFDHSIISNIAMRWYQFRKFLRVPSSKRRMFFAAQREVARFKSTDPQGFACPGAAAPHGAAGQGSCGSRSSTPEGVAHQSDRSFARR